MLNQNRQSLLELSYTAVLISTIFLLVGCKTSQTNVVDQKNLIDLEGMSVNLTSLDDWDKQWTDNGRYRIFLKDPSGKQWLMMLRAVETNGALKDSKELYTMITNDEIAIDDFELLEENYRKIGKKNFYYCLEEDSLFKGKRYFLLHKGVGYILSYSVAGPHNMQSFYDEKLGIV